MAGTDTQCFVATISYMLVCFGVLHFRCCFSVILILHPHHCLQSCFAFGAQMLAIFEDKVQDTRILLSRSVIVRFSIFHMGSQMVGVLFVMYILMYSDVNVYMQSLLNTTIHQEPHFSKKRRMTTQFPIGWDNCLKPLSTTRYRVTNSKINK